MGQFDSCKEQVRNSNHLQKHRKIRSHLSWLYAKPWLEVCEFIRIVILFLLWVSVFQSYWPKGIHILVFGLAFYLLNCEAMDLLPCLVLQCPLCCWGAPKPPWRILPLETGFAKRETIAGLHQLLHHVIHLFRCLSRQQNTEQEYSCTGLPTCKESIDILDTTEGKVFEYNVTVFNWLADWLAS